MEELKPCPFCGEKATLFVNYGVRVLCTKCKAATKVLVDYQFGDKVAGSAVRSVIKAWNRRVDDD